MAEFKMKDQLFKHRTPLTHFSGLRVNTQSAKGLACRLNTTSSQTSKISLVGVAVDAVMDGKISVSAVSDDNAYIEYLSSAGNIIPLLVFLEDKNDFSVKINPVNVALVDDDHTRRIVSLAVIASILYCPEMREKMCRVNPDLTDIFTEVFTCIDLSQDYVSMYITDSNLFMACDLMYYGLFKESCNVSFQIEDVDVFGDQLQRFVQTGAIEHIPETVKPAGYVPAPKAKKAAAKQQNPLFTEPLADFFKRCKKGEFLIDYPWPEVRKNLIVPLSFLDSFFPTESFRLMLLSVWYQIKAVRERMANVEKKYPGKKLSELVQTGAYDEVMGKNPINIKVMGKPGTGKTTVIEAVLASLGYPKGLISCKDRMEEDEIEGMNKFVNGTVLNIPTRAGQLHSDGGAILLEEFNLPDPGILQGALGQALAYPFILKEDGYKEKRRHPLTIYFATMNIGTAGTKPMNEALSSRFPEGYVIEDVPEDEFVSILVAAGYDKPDCRKVYKVYTQILNYLREYHEELSLSVTLRHCLNALDKLKIGFTEKQAYENTFLSQLYSSDPEVANDVRETLGVLM